MSPAAILSTDRPGCLAALAAGETVLMVQDTTALTWAHPATAGLGRVSRYRHQRAGLWGAVTPSFFACMPKVTP